MPEKDEIARLLADSHRQMEPTITRIIRLMSDREADAREPVKLLEVNPSTSPSGVLPIAFGSDPPDVPYPSVVIEITDHEFEKISNGEMSLPDGWTLGSTLHPAAVG